MMSSETLQPRWDLDDRRSQLFQPPVLIIRVFFSPSLMFSLFPSLMSTSLFIHFTLFILSGAKIGSWCKKKS